MPDNFNRKSSSTAASSVTPEKPYDGTLGEYNFEQFKYVKIPRVKAEADDLDDELQLKKKMRALGKEQQAEVEGDIEGLEQKRRQLRKTGGSNDLKDEQVDIELKQKRRTLNRYKEWNKKLDAEVTRLRANRNALDSHVRDLHAWNDGGGKKIRPKRPVLKPRPK